ncbi:MAG: DUF1610 domain-containing protein [Candidatus Helarchaeota archaeon]|nr:DUF1610 domain-containing protein [Candidatus Helarchaeota archaeon]
MLANIETPICASCGKIMIPREFAVKFSCPNCSNVTIWRCERCRQFARFYKCSKCDFEGP